MEILDQTDKYAKMVLARKKILNGKTPRERGEEKMRIALDWIYRFGWSSPTIIEKIGGAARSGLGARLIKNGLLERTRTESGGCVKGVPDYMLTLTQAGIIETERKTDVLLPYDTDPFRIDQSKMRHDHLAQAITAKALVEGKISRFYTERELAERSQSGKKQPDVLWIVDGKKIAIEIELTSKHGRFFDDFRHKCVMALTGENKRFDSILMVTESPALKEKYEAAMVPGKKYDYWEKNGIGRWGVVGKKTVPDEIDGRFTCTLLD